MALPVEDILAIQKLAADYNHLIDSGSAEAWAQLFVPDGTLEFGMPEGVKGHEDLAAFAATINPATRHVISNLSIDGEGEEAVASVYLEVYYTAPPGQPRELAITGIYRDQLRKEGGRWRYVSRQMMPDLGDWAAAPETIPGL
ncbi:MAG: nuclear transport factor 2 family protein [Acidimicrobiia bacterium]|nr:nuclear transport factor 2 family protein [Acidimicrobiia bacterium]MXZ84989.1 nuclear transport factor 2 family protein [Acidimicrobiia bacterium]MYB74527.1 nuclear transport factor 2 family protein [Acidimicrobiia bacterium]MYG71062.1 nuclear transport factor 2 family protein [Acidimicrobiia bacterium]MYH94923.1 nuclear transport factor 2 family protein [Acidimicrobiia bacterium]